jgi:hypothetical protein
MGGRKEKVREGGEVPKEKPTIVVKASSGEGLKRIVLENEKEDHAEALNMLERAMPMLKALDRELRTARGPVVHREERAGPPTGPALEKK